MSTSHYSRKERQLKLSVKKLHELLESKSASSFDIEKLVCKIKQLINSLKNVVAMFKLKRIVGSLAVVLGLSFSNSASAQYFAYPITDPFGLLSTTDHTVQSIAFADLDDDGDFDCLNSNFLYNGYSYGLDFVYQENIGSANTPNFSTQNVNPFGLQSQPLTIPFALRFAKFVDLDGDGDFDILSSDVSYNTFTYQMNSSFTYIENVGSATSPMFGSPVSNPFGLSDTNQIIHINVCDIDNDGDFDLISSANDNPPGGYGYPSTSIMFHENIGSSTVPLFSSPQNNPFGLSSSTSFELKSFLDIDADGDFDIIYFNYGYYSSGDLSYIENIGTPALANFSSSPVLNPFGLDISNYEANTVFAMHDLDGDGDGDLIGGNDDEDILYFENVLVQQPVTYECINYACVDPGTGLGTYTTLADCNTNCTPPTSYDCDFYTGNCYLSYGSYGQYPTLLDCQANCTPPPATWNCDAMGNCYDPGYGMGMYSSLSDCQANCAPPVSWNCVSPGDCQDPGDGSGTFPSLSDCQDNCAVPITFDCDAITGCYDPGTGLGLYTSLAGCQANCNPAAIEYNKSYNLKLFPNPVNSKLHIVSDKNILKVIIYDNLGRIIIEENNPSELLNVQDLEKGIYSIAIIFEEITLIRKFTK